MNLEKKRFKMINSKKNIFIVSSIILFLYLFLQNDNGKNNILIEQKKTNLSGIIDISKQTLKNNQNVENNKIINKNINKT